MNGKVMKNCKIILPVLLVVTLFASCKKDHYNVGNVHGVNAEGEVVAPLASASFTVKDLMERFGMLDLLYWSADGDLAMHYTMQMDSVLEGSEILKFNDLDYEEQYTYPNPYPTTTPPYLDTVLSFERTITFESEHVFVREGFIKSGHLNFITESNAGHVQHVVLRSPNLKDADGHDFVLDTPVQADTFGIDLSGLRYFAEEVNTLTLNCEVTVGTQATTEPELYLNFNIMGRDLAFREMQGFVENYSSRDRVDTVFTLFPGLIDGQLGLEGVRLKITERNNFPMGARFIVDTLTLSSEGNAPFSIIEPLPLPIEMPPAMQEIEVLNKVVDGRISAEGGRLLASGDFIVNPENHTDMVAISDTNRIDLCADVEIPFSFRVGDLKYVDTVNMNIDNLDMPELIKELTLELTFNSVLPFHLNASFYMYNSETGMVTDTLLGESKVIKASFDGKPTTTEVTLVVDEDRVENVLHSDRIIMSYELDTENHKMHLNINQKLDLSLKGRAKYKGNVDF